MTAYWYLQCNFFCLISFVKVDSFYRLIKQSPNKGPVTNGFEDELMTRRYEKRGGGGGGIKIYTLCLNTQMRRSSGHKLESLHTRLFRQMKDV